MTKSNLFTTILLVAAAVCFAAEDRKADTVNQAAPQEGLQWSRDGARGGWGAEGWSGEMPPQYLPRHEQRALSEESFQGNVAGNDAKKERWIMGWCSRPCGSVTTCSYRCWMWV